jgi:hypothetical protein
MTKPDPKSSLACLYGLHRDCLLEDCGCGCGHVEPLARQRLATGDRPTSNG